LTSLRTATGVVALALVGLAGLTACGSSSSTAKTGATSPVGSGGPAAADSTPAASTPADAGANELKVEAQDYAYVITGSPRPGLVTMTFTNTGKYAHEMSLSKLKAGKTLAEVKAALQSPDGEQAAQALLDNPDAEYTTPSIVGPQRSVQVAAQLPAGHYVVTCFLPGPDGMPHVAMGMLGEVTVAGDASTAAAPSADGTIELTDSGITVPATFAAGGTFAVRNGGTKPHDFSVAQLTDQPLGAYFQCVAGSFGKNTPIDECPGTLAGGVGTLEPGGTAYLTIHLGKGSYGYVSTQGDGADFQAGLNGTFTVA